VETSHRPAARLGDTQRRCRMIAADDGMPLFTGAALVSETATKNHCHDLASVRKLEISRVPCRIRDERIFGAKIEKSLDHFQLCCICVRYQTFVQGSGFRRPVSLKSSSWLSGVPIRRSHLFDLTTKSSICLYAEPHMRCLRRHISPQVPQFRSLPRIPRRSIP
jgi:hypothetical protein